SERVWHGGSIARGNGCTNGCMSVDDKSSFSYQVAAGNTISAYIGVVLIRKAIANNKSSLACNSSRHFTSCSFISSIACANKLLVAPNKCLIKYSCPLAELETRLDRQTNNVLGKFSGASGSSIANSNSFVCKSETTRFTMASSVSSPRSFASS